MLCASTVVYLDSAYQYLNVVFQYSGVPEGFVPVHWSTAEYPDVVFQYSGLHGHIVLVQCITWKFCISIVEYIDVVCQYSSVPRRCVSV